jgi:hypothetical protein
MPALFIFRGLYRKTGLVFLDTVTTDISMQKCKSISTLDDTGTKKRNLASGSKVSAFYFLKL